MWKSERKREVEFQKENIKIKKKKKAQKKMLNEKEEESQKKRLNKIEKKIKKSPKKHQFNFGLICISLPKYGI